MPGTLWLVGTPIGNLGDVADRAREVLGAVDVIACEDTRRTRGLLTHLGIRAGRLVSFYEAKEREQVPAILRLLEQGSDVALVTDAGMPGLSDPGYRLVAACVEAGFAVDSVPGPTALVQALVLSGLPTDRFSFEGFLPRKPGARRERLAGLADDPRTLVFYESPRRLGDLLRDAAELLGAERPAAVARELTKLHQEVRRGSLGELAEEAVDVRGEVVLVVGGAARREADLRPLAERVAELTGAGVSRRDAVARVAEEAGVSRRALYEASLADG